MQVYCHSTLQRPGNVLFCLEFFAIFLGARGDERIAVGFPKRQCSKVAQIKTIPHIRERAVTLYSVTVFHNHLKRLGRTHSTHTRLPRKFCGCALPMVGSAPFSCALALTSVDACAEMLETHSGNMTQIIITFVFRVSEACFCGVDKVAGEWRPPPARCFARGECLAQCASHVPKMLLVFYSCMSALEASVQLPDSKKHDETPQRCWSMEDSKMLVKAGKVFRLSLSMQVYAERLEEAQMPEL